MRLARLLLALLVPWLFRVPVTEHVRHKPSSPTRVVPPPAVPVTTSPALAQLDGGTWTPNDGTGVAWTTFVSWSRVAVCEEGSWIGWSGPTYPDSLGISAQNWSAYGGGQTLAPDAQIVVAERIQPTPPDQTTCAAW